MTHAQYCFEDRAAADRAVELLVRKGFPADHLRVHWEAPHTEASGRAEADELISGGFVTNFFGLLEGIFENDQTVEHAHRHGVHLERGGAIVDVDADNAFQEAMADQVMDATGCYRHGAWEDPSHPRGSLAASH